ncbi:Helix-turn-helix domain protein [Symmachiella macrocystis]|uniref:Helix-turn-helix domain protein n=1 Tax=Symmachiella macrocystis TaxID=2527985 RepID=A0A5C6B6C5_9PLAN|nr:helix-turn-helix domain-containing protein [Symmachiella macrocystis]TWU06879.1 Helix-turn-helix domain protein [Symmachiella macrocystis]
MRSNTPATSTPTPLALRPRDAAIALGISPRTLWGLTAPRGPIPCLRIGHGKRQSVLYPVAELQAWLSRQAEAEKRGDDDD